MVVREIPIKINTETGKNSISTPLIKGKLVALVIKNIGIQGSIAPIHITVRSFRDQEIVIYNNVSFTGVRYLPVKISSVASDDEQFNYAPDYYYLNEKLLIQVSGMRNKEIEVIIKYENA